MSSNQLNKADKYYEKGNYGEALAIYLTLLNEHQEYPNFHEKVAKCQFELGDLDDAQQECQITIQLDEKSTNSYYLLALILERKKELVEAERMVRRAIELDPNLAHLYNSLGVILGNQNKLDESLGAYQKAIEVDPKFWKAHFNLATIYRGKRRFTEALHSSMRAFRIAPSLQTAYWALVSYEFSHPNIVATFNILLLLIIVMFPSILLMPLAFVLALAIVFRASIWMRNRNLIMSVITIVIGLLAILWYFYRVFFR